MTEKKITEIKIPKAEFINADSGVDYHWWYKNATPLHTHTYYEMVVIYDGPVTQICNGKKYVMEKGDLFIIKPGDVHMFQASQNSYHLNISIVETELKKLCDFIEPSLFANINDNAPLLIKIPDVECNFLVYLVDQIKIERDNSNSKQYIAQIKNIINNLLNSLYNHFELQTSKRTDLPLWLSEYIKNIMLPENLEKRITDLYTIAPCSQFMLNSCFKKYFGKTLVAFVKQIRLEYAVKLLLHSSYPISMIANKISYTTSHFIHEFTAFYGMSPNAYRNEITKR